MVMVSGSSCSVGKAEAAGFDLTIEQRCEIAGLGQAWLGVDADPAAAIGRLMERRLKPEMG